MGFICGLMVLWALIGISARIEDKRKGKND